MDFNKIFNQIKYDLDRASKNYNNSEDATERRNFANNHLNTIQYIESILAGGVSDFYRNPLQNLLEMAKKEQAIMQKEVDHIRKAVVMGGGNEKNGKKPGESDNEKLAAGLLETIVSEKPNVHWDDIAGLFEAKKSLNEALIMPIKYPDFFQGNVQPWKGILLYGPPGTGKTFLAKACATECDSTFFSVSSSDLMSKYLGESEKLIKELFAKANEKAPSIIFIDEIDSMCGNRSEGENESSRRVKTEFLVQMQGVGSKNDKVLILGATNLPWALDPAVRRRFERRVYIPLPDFEARRYLIRNKLKGLDKMLSDEDIKLIAERTDGYSGADLEILVRDAAFEPLHLAQATNKFRKVNVNGQFKHVPMQPNAVGPDIITSVVYDLPERSLMLPDVNREDLIKAMMRSKPSVSKKDLDQYTDWTKQYGISD